MIAAAKKTEPSATLCPILDVTKVREFAGNEALAEFFRRFPPIWSLSDDAIRNILSTTYYIRDGEEIVGLLALTGFDAQARKVEMGVAIQPMKGRRALGASACELAADYIFNGLGYNKIVCQMLATRSDLEALLASYGFKHEAYLRQSCFWRGQFQDEIQMSLLASEHSHGT